MTTMTEQTVTGPAARALLAVEQRDRFDAEWRDLVVYATRSFDLDPLAALIRRWWVQAGGDPAAAEAARAEYERQVDARPTSGGEWITDWFPRSGPVVFERLPEYLRIEMEQDWRTEVMSALATSYDLDAAQRKVGEWWMHAMYHAHPAVMAEDQALIDAVNRGDLSQLSQLHTD